MKYQKGASGLTRPLLILSTTNQLWTIHWKFCNVDSFDWVALNIRYYIDCLE